MKLINLVKVKWVINGSASVIVYYPASCLDIMGHRLWFTFIVLQPYLVLFNQIKPTRRGDHKFCILQFESLCWSVWLCPDTRWLMLVVCVWLHLFVQLEKQRATRLYLHFCTHSSSFSEEWELVIPPLGSVLSLCLPPPPIIFFLKLPHVTLRFKAHLDEMLVSFRKLGFFMLSS